MATFGVMLVAVGCSDSNEISVQPIPAVERSAAISTGDAICKQLREDVQQMVDAFKASKANATDDEARDFLTNTLFPRIDRGVGDMHRIGEPTKDRAGFDDSVRALDDDLTALKQAAGSDPVKLLGSKIPLFVSSADDFTDYGFTECGKN